MVHHDTYNSTSIFTRTDILTFILGIIEIEEIRIKMKLVALSFSHLSLYL
nr:MAG TPA: hypothetical protein [Caudoviricetes sp.]DAW95788.1 MAG TPA: hypothetical protein [Caudoviricetes sp.]